MDQETLLADFDKEVASRCELIRANAENICANLQSSLELTLLAIPESVRKMPLKMLITDFGGDTQRAAEYLSKNPVQTKPIDSKASTKNAESKPIRRTAPRSVKKEHSKPKPVSKKV
ncbi:hypothetical protein GPJ56_000733 [Histomonas meleagridis]|uniref:uncharacterized protein n=1 Tax=Histomonas meleagridis TaxID=135588 RepID=UPI003559F965|nr:hypothetical protein GPJ56_000733 [Histomonas meleagridis]KAH0804508.1 hypothetical protein GO595_003338 [Histomonas meleagridis]